MLDALARTTTDQELFAALCGAARERDGIERAWVEQGLSPPADSPRAVAAPLVDDDGPYATLQLRGPAATRELADQLASAAQVIRGVRQTVANRFRRALAGSEITLFMMDRELRYTWLEAPALGIRPDAIVGLTDADILSEAAAAELTALKRRVIERGEHVAQEIMAGDRCFWVAARPVRDAGGEITGLAGQSLNVTARKYAERELDRIAAAAEYGADAVISLDAAGRVQRWNRSAERLFGYTAQEARNRTLQELGPAPDGHAAAMIAQVLREQRPVTFDAVRHHRDGTPVDVRITLVPWDVDGEVVGVTGIAVDVSDRKRAERERERAIEDLHEAQRLARIGSWSWGPDGLTLTPQLYEIYGLAPDTLLAEPAHVLPYVHPDDRRELQRRLQALIDGGPAVEHEHRIVRGDGEERVVRTIARRDPRRPGSFLGTVQDVTEQRRLHALDALFEAGFNASPVGMVLLTETGHVVQANDSLAEMLGYDSPAELPGTYWTDLVFPEDLSLLAGMAEALKTADQVLVQVRYRHRSGRPVHGLSATTAVRTVANEPPTIFSQILDISTRVRTEQALAASEARYRRILETTLEGVWTLDADDVTTFANRALAEMLDTEPAAMTGRPLTDFLESPAELHRGGHHELALRSATGRSVWALIAANPMLDDDGRYLGALAMVTDISDRKAMEVRLQHLADHDHLTGIFNRRRLLEELDEHLRMAARTGRGGAALVIDLDHFKFINDTRGHQAGDAVLRAVGEILRARLRSTDVLARLGGDEFALVLPEVTGEEALTVARELRDLLRERDSAPPIVASIGVVHFTGSEQLSPDEILVCADTALYEAKELGGDQARLYTGQATGALRWVQRLRTALAEDQLVLHGQPILDLRSGRIVKHELLVRMQGEHGELIAPGDFLPTAERFGLIQEVDAWVVRRGLLLAAGGMPVAINLSACSVTQGLIESLARGAVVGGLDPAQVTFEITETAALGNLDAARQFVETLAGLGFTVALDDFGTGFGSFVYLKHIPARFLKIDMEFVRGLRHSPVDQEVVRSIVGIARSLGKETIAEGVEDAATLDLLHGYGVDYVQGFAIGRPGPLVD